MMMEIISWGRFLKTNGAGIALVDKVCLSYVNDVVALVVILSVSSSKVVSVIRRRAEDCRRMFKTSPDFPMDETFVFKPLATAAEHLGSTVGISAHVRLKVVEDVRSSSMLDTT
jgi:hypothetical protein